MVKNLLKRGNIVYCLGYKNITFYNSVYLYFSINLLLLFIIPMKELYLYRP